MAKGYSTDLRARAVALVEAGESRREVARLLDLAASTTIRWMDRWQTTGNVAAKPGTGYCHSPLEQHEQWLLDLVAAEPDLTLDEIGTRLASAKKLTVVIAASRRKPLYGGGITLARRPNSGNMERR
jgi:transposase